MKKVIILFMLINLAILSNSQRIIEGIKNRSVEIIKEAVEDGEEYNFDYEGEDIIFYGIKIGNLEVLEYLVDLKGLNFVDKEGFTLLHYAIKEKQYEFIKYLLENGASVDKKNKMGVTPLMVAVYLGEVEVMKLLFEYGAKVEENDSYFNDAFYWALMSPNLSKEILEVLIDNGAKVDRAYLGESTPKILLSRDRFDLLEYLVKNHNLDIVDKKREGLSTIAWLYNNKELRRYIDPMKELGAKEMSFGEESHLIYKAMRRDDLELIEFMISRGFDLNKRDAQGNTVLIAIVNLSSDEFFEGIIKLGAEVDVKVDSGETLIEYVRKKGYSEKEKILMKYIEKDNS